jgi:hypothetical protein
MVAKPSSRRVIKNLTRPPLRSSSGIRMIFWVCCRGDRPFHRTHHYHTFRHPIVGMEKPASCRLSDLIASAIVTLVAILLCST